MRKVDEETHSAQIPQDLIEAPGANEQQENVTSTHDQSSSEYLLTNIDYMSQEVINYTVIDNLESCPSHLHGASLTIIEHGDIDSGKYLSAGLIKIDIGLAYKKSEAEWKYSDNKGQAKTACEVATFCASKGVTFLQIFSCYGGALPNKIDRVIEESQNLVISTAGEEAPIDQAEVKQTLKIKDRYFDAITEANIDNRHQTIAKFIINIVWLPYPNTIKFYNKRLHHVSTCIVYPAIEKNELLDLEQHFKNNINIFLNLYRDTKEDEMRKFINFKEILKDVINKKTGCSIDFDECGMVKSIELDDSFKKSYFKKVFLYHCSKVSDDDWQGIKKLKDLINDPDLQVYIDDKTSFIHTSAEFSCIVESPRLLSSLIKRNFINLGQPFDNSGGVTVLHTAVAHGNAESVEILLETNKVDVNSATEAGNYSIDYAIQNNRTNIIKLLLLHGAKIPEKYSNNEELSKLDAECKAATALCLQLNNEISEYCHPLSFKLTVSLTQMSHHDRSVNICLPFYTESDRKYLRYTGILCKHLTELGIIVENDRNFTSIILEPRSVKVIPNHILEKIQEELSLCQKKRTKEKSNESSARCAGLFSGKDNHHNVTNNPNSERNISPKSQSLSKELVDALEAEISRLEKKPDNVWTGFQLWVSNSAAKNNQNKLELFKKIKANIEREGRTHLNTDEWKIVESQTGFYLKGAATSATRLAKFSPQSQTGPTMGSSFR